MFRFQETDRNLTNWAVVDCNEQPLADLLSNGQLQAQQWAAMGSSNYWPMSATLNSPTTLGGRVVANNIFLYPLPMLIRLMPAVHNYGMVVGDFFFLY